MTELLHYTFMQHAIVAGILASIVCGIVGSLVVVNRLVFMAGGIAHTAYGGVGLAFFSGFPVLPCTLGFTALSTLLLGALTVKQRFYVDAMVGLLWAMGMAVGIILLNITPGYNVNLMSYLFGSILTIPASDLWVMLGITFVVILLTIYFYQDFLQAAFDAEYAASQGIKIDRLYFLLLLMTAFTVVMLVQIIGLILVIALLTIPAYLASQHTRSLVKMMWSAIGWSLLACLIGLIISYYTDIASGASIVAVITLICFIFLGLRGMIRWSRAHVKPA